MVYERLSAGVGTNIYDDMDYDTVYFDKDLAHDFASWIDGPDGFYLSEWFCSSHLRLWNDYDGAVYAVVWNSQTYIKRSIVRKMGCA